MPLKAIVSKCVVDWQFDGDVSIVNMGYGLSVTKFPNAVDCNRVLDGQPWFWKLREGGGRGGESIPFSHWKLNFDPVKENLSTVLL